MKCKFRKNELESIVNDLKNYPFSEKMLICQEHSKKLMKPTYLDILNTTNAIYPWELEVFAELSLFSESPTATCTFINSDSKFINMINTIRNYKHPFLKKQNNLDFTNAFIMATSLQQFKVQENILDRLYRYEYFWNFANNKIDMGKSLSNFSGGLHFAEFMNLGLLVFFYSSIPYPTTKIIQTLMLKNKKVLNLLSITREEYQKKQTQKLSEDYANAIFGFNYLRTFPFIEFDNYIYLPLPYLIIDAVTDSLLTRITIDDNTLREIIGKEVAQSYIEDILKEGNIYDEVLPETTYYINRNKIDSPDILIRKDELICFIDTKLSTPKLDIRNFNEEAIQNTISRYAKNIIQLYKRLKEFNSGLYYPFKEKITIDKNNIFGIVALLEDSYITRKQIYQEVFRELNIDYDSEEAKYIKTNIKITNFRDLESIAFRSHNIFESLIKKKNNPKEWNDFGLYDVLLYKKDKNNPLPSVKTFNEKCIKIFLDSTDEFAKMGFIKQSNN